MFTPSTRRKPFPQENGTKTKKKRPRLGAAGVGAGAGSDSGVSLCSFCGQVPAAVTVQMPVLIRKKRDARNFCLTCYYTSSAVRQDASQFVSVHDQEQVDMQLVPLQQLFSESYVQLRKQLQEESEKVFLKQKSDPLALLHHGGLGSSANKGTGTGLAPRRMVRTVVPPPPPHPTAFKKKDGKASDGGFLTSIPLPERLLKTQQRQAELQHEQIQRMNKVLEPTSTTTTTTTTVSSPQSGRSNTNVYKRRKSSNKSIWNLAMDLGTKSVDAAQEKHDAAPPCSCGSRNVRTCGNITSRDGKKTETWGMKDRNEGIVSRYQCNDCGKIWNEEG